MNERKEHYLTAMENTAYPYTGPRGPLQFWVEPIPVELAEEAQRQWDEATEPDGELSYATPIDEPNSDYSYTMGKAYLITRES